MRLTKEFGWRIRGRLLPALNARTVGLSARIHAISLSLAGGIAKPFNYRGMNQLTNYLSHIFANGHFSEVSLPYGGRLRISLSDSYWTRLLAPGYQYEPDLGWIISTGLTKNRDAQFLDLGANLGYWSATASALAPGRVTAVEASPPMHENLTKTARLNANRFSVWPNAAIWSISGENAEIVTHDIRHAGASIVDRKDKIGQKGYTKYNVQTASIDDIASTLPRGPLIIKLDVEGAEIPAFEGATETIATRDVIFLYEDHGQDASSLVSAHILAMGHSVAVADKHGTVKGIKSAEDVSAVKSRSSVGYNFIAYKPGSTLAATLGL